MKKEIFWVGQSMSKSLCKYQKVLSPSTTSSVTVPGRPLFFCIAAQEWSLCSLLTQENEEGKERAVYCFCEM